VAELNDASEARKEAARRADAERAARERARKAAEDARKRVDYLESLRGRESRLWSQVKALVNTRQPGSYDEATALLVDLRDLASRTNQQAELNQNLAELRAEHTKKIRFIERLDAAGLVPDSSVGLFRESDSR
jgi:hypothetical protein